MPNSLSSLDKRLRDLANRIPKNADLALRKTALIIDQSLVLSTPVLTGRARSNWQVSLDTPVSKELPPYVDIPPTAGFGERQNAQAAIAQGQSQIERFSSGTHQVIIIQNNLDYIGKLAAGLSPQAAAGWIDVSIKEGTDTLKNIKVTVKKVIS